MHGALILEPGPAPAEPGPTPLDHLGRQLPGHAEAVARYQAHGGLIAAYATAAADAEHVRTQLAAAGDALADRYRGLTGPHWMLTAASIAGGMAAAVMQYNAHALRGTANYLSTQAAATLARALSSPVVPGFRHLWYQDLDRAGQLSQNAQGMLARADDLEARAKPVGPKSISFKVGGAAALAGIGYDIYAGKDPTQAAVVGGGSFLASVGAGAAIGSLIPVPGVGTAVGAVVGAGVGIFVSGALDSVFEDGPDVGAAAEAGLDAVTDTGKAIGGAVMSVGKGIGGLFS